MIIGLPSSLLTGSSLMLQGLAFFEHYRAVRQKEFGQEVEFNLGRIYHGLGKFHFPNAGLWLFKAKRVTE
jgi:hypothetical protein